MYGYDGFFLQWQLTQGGGVLLASGKKSHAKFAKFRKDYAGKLCSSLMEDFAKTYFASLVCSHPVGKAQAKRVLLCVLSL